jgi:hypothetical protein
MSRTPEGRVKDAVKKWLAERGAYFYMVVPNGFSRAGVPDFLVCLHGRFVGIETKAPGKRRNTTALQKRELAWIETSGGVSLVVDDVSQLDTYFGDTHGRQAESQKAAASAA